MKSKTYVVMNMYHKFKLIKSYTQMKVDPRSYERN